METETQTQVTKKFVSLAEKRPDLAKEWNYEKNGNLRPEDVTVNSLERPHPTDVGWGFYGLAPVKPR